MYRLAAGINLSSLLVRSVCGLHAPNVGSEVKYFSIHLALLAADWCQREKGGGGFGQHNCVTPPAGLSGMVCLCAATLPFLFAGCVGWVQLQVSPWLAQVSSGFADFLAEQKNKPFNVHKAFKMRRETMTMGKVYMYYRLAVCKNQILNHNVPTISILCRK